MNFEAPEDIQGDGGNYLTEPGTYHVVITAVKDGLGPKGGAIDGFTFEMDVLAGTADGCSGKTHTECLFAPNLTKSEDNQTMSKRKLAAFFIATGVMTPDQLGKAVSIDVKKAEGAQLLIKLERQMLKNESTGKYDVPTKFLQISYSDMFHVDDPAVKDVPKNKDALGMIDKIDRHDESWFAFKAKKGSAKKEMVAASTSDFDDL